jgi:hypothetical protein
MISRRAPALGLSVLALLALAAVAASAQTPPVLAPSNVILPNYTPQGPGLTAGLEGGASVARGDDASANWYNPAGLSRVKNSSLFATGGAIQWLHVTPNAFPTNVGSSSTLPVQIGLVWREPFDYVGWTMALSFTTENNWEHSLSSEQIGGTSAEPERFAYAASSKFERRTASVGAGYSPDEKLRIGGSADVVWTTVEAGQSLNDRIVGAKTSPSALVTSYNRTRFVHLRVTVGGQYDVGENIKIGGTVRTPGIMFANNGSAGLDGTVYAAGVTKNYAYYDEHPDMTLKLPFEFIGGAAYVTPKGAVEADLRVVQGSGVYDYFVPSKALFIVTDNGAGTVTTTQADFPTRTVDASSVVDFMVGGRYLVSDKGKLTVHGGFSTVNSPVGDNDQVFRKANLRRLTGGLSGSTEHLSFAAGVSYQAGTTPLYPVFTSQVGQSVSTTIDVTGVAFLYSIGVRF